MSSSTPDPPSAISMSHGVESPEEASPPTGEIRRVAPGHLLWIPVAAVAGFFASFVFGDVLTLPVDLYYLLYFTVVIGLFAYYVKRTRLALRAWVSRRLGWGVALGVLGGLVLVKGVLTRPATPHLSGAMIAWAVFWRGLVYGSVDGILLFAFPWIVTWRAMDAEGREWGVRIRAAALAFVAILFTTTTYHLGYGDFRSQKIIQPDVGSTLGSIATLVTANPVASPVSHVFLHVAAVLHTPETDLYLPPHRDRAAAGPEGVREARAGSPPSAFRSLHTGNGIIPGPPPARLSRRRSANHGPWWYSRHAHAAFPP